MDTEFKVGDVVQLKSGGPEMTIDEIEDYGDGLMKATCVWFDERKKRYRELFVLATLKHVEKG